MYTVEYADGYYIAMNGVGLINFEDPEDGEFANFVCSALNKAVEQSVQATGVNAAHTCPIHPIVFDVDGCFMCNPRA